MAVEEIDTLIYCHGYFASDADIKFDLHTSLTCASILFDHGW